MVRGSGGTDLVLCARARRLVARGLRFCGTVQINTERPGAGPCDMDVKVLPEGAVLRILQVRGRDAHGCRIDPLAHETAVGIVPIRLAARADVLIVNTFGPHEAEGRG